MIWQYLSLFVHLLTVKLAVQPANLNLKAWLFCTAVSIFTLVPEIQRPGPSEPGRYDTLSVASHMIATYMYCELEAAPLALAQLLWMKEQLYPKLLRVRGPAFCACTGTGHMIQRGTGTGCDVDARVRGLPSNICL